jgi:hypothetical protein
VTYRISYNLLIPIHHGAPGFPTSLSLTTSKLKQRTFTTHAASSLSLWLYSPSNLARFFSFFEGTPWTGDQPVARPLPTHRTTQTQNKRTDIHVLSGIRTHDSSVQASKDSSYLRPRGHCDRQAASYLTLFYLGHSEMIETNLIKVF